MSFSVTMFVYGRQGPEVFLEPVPKGPSLFINVLLHAVCLGKFEPIDCPTFIDDVVLGGHQEVPDGIPPLKMHLYSSFITKTL